MATKSAGLGGWLDKMMTEDQVYGVTCVDSATGLSLGARGVAKNEDAPLIKWFLDNKASEPGVGCYQYEDYLVYTKQQDNIIIAIYKSEGSLAKNSSTAEISEGGSHE